MKEYRNETLKVKLTNSEKEKIKTYADNHNMTISEVVRQLCRFIFEGDQQ